MKQTLGLLHKQEKDRLRAHPLQEAGTLIVVADKEKMLNKTIYLLPRGDFVKYATSSDKRDHHPQKRSGTISTLRISSEPLFVARFRDLPPGRYTAWTGWGVANPKHFDIQVDNTDVTELLLT